MLGNHLLGLYEKALPDAMSLGEKLKAAHTLGFDYLEISIDESDERISRLYWDEIQRKEFALILAESTVKLQSMCLSAHRRFPFGSADIEKRDKAREIMRRALEFAHTFGIRVIQLAGYDVYYEQSTEDSRMHFMAGLKEACAMAAKYQVMLAMEIMDTPFLNSISKYLKYSEALNSPWFAVYPDIGNLSAWPENNVMQELELGAHEIVQVHLKETLAKTPSFPGKFRNVPFGSGCVNFPEIFSKLESLSYSGPYTIEMWCNSPESAISEIASAKKFMESKFYAQT